MSTQPTKQPSPWLQLLRPPNLLTVPGDPIAGYLLASADGAVEPVRLLAAAAASLCLYAAGLLVNDLADQQEDARERPERPLPSGRVEPRAVLAAAAALFIAGLAICWQLGEAARLVGLALAISILLYDLGGKRIRIAGAFNMGLCRGFSLLLGAAATPAGQWLAPAPTLAFDVLVLYVAAITHLAREEMTPRRRGVVRWGPAFVLAAGFALLAQLNPVRALPTILIFCGGFIFAAVITLSVGDAFDVALPHDAPRAVFVLDKELRGWLVPRLIGLLLGTILLLQASLVAAADAGEASMVWGVTLLALWPLHRMMSRRFYES